MNVQPTHQGGDEEANMIFADDVFTSSISPKDFYDLQEEMHIAMTSNQAFISFWF